MLHFLRFFKIIMKLKINSENFDCVFTKLNTVHKYIYQIIIGLFSNRDYFHNNKHNK